MNFVHGNIIFLLKACQFACRVGLNFCMLIVILPIDWLLDFNYVIANLHNKHGTQKRTDPMTFHDLKHSEACCL